MTRLNKNLLFLIVFIVTISSAAYGQTDSFARFLFQGEYYSESRIEYLRLIHSNTNPANISIYKYWVGKSYIESGDFVHGEKIFSELLQGNDISQNLRYACTFESIRIQYLAKSLIPSDLEDPTKISSLDPRIAGLTMWGFVQLRDWESAQKTAEYIQQKNIDSFSKTEKAAYIKAITILQDKPDFHEKSPYTAAVLSGIVPGLGHLYAGNTTNAIGSFVLNTATILLTMYGIHEKKYIYAGVFGFLELGWYAGNITSAYQDAELANSRSETKFAKRIENLFPYPLGFSLSTEY